MSREVGALAATIEEIYGTSLSVAEKRRLAGRVAAGWSSNGNCGSGSEEAAPSMQDAVAELERLVHLVAGSSDLPRAKQQLRDSGAATLASRLGRLSRVRNGLCHPDVRLDQDIRAHMVSKVQEAEVKLDEPEEEMKCFSKIKDMDKPLETDFTEKDALKDRESKDGELSEQLRTLNKDFRAALGDLQAKYDDLAEELRAERSRRIQKENAESAEWGEGEVVQKDYAEFAKCCDDRSRNAGFESMTGQGVVDKERATSLATGDQDFTGAIKTHKKSQAVWQPWKLKHLDETLKDWRADKLRELLSQWRLFANATSDDEEVH